jgi:type II secretory pathway predicted ATPase ExeA
VFERHFGLNATPFRKDVPALGLFPARLHHELLLRLNYALEQAQIVVVCGETGTGKTTVLRALLAQQSPARYRFLYLPHPPRSPRELFSDLLTEIGADVPWSTIDARARTRRQLMQLAEAGRTPVVICDEAQDIPAAMLEELRLLTCFELDARPVLALILAGHPELARHVRKKGLEALAQRVGLWFTLVGLDRDEVGRYLQHHLELAGCQQPLFTPDAVTALFLATKGVPRALGRLATRCLDQAASDRLDHVDGQLVETLAVDWE